MRRLARASSLTMLLVELLLDCIVDIFGVVIQIVMFLFYWETVRTGDEASTDKHIVPSVPGEVA